MKTKIGIVLSGGGARGIAHLDFKGIRRIWNCPHISGTSAGAITGAFMQQVTRYQRLSTY
jgi:NTE family protein